MLNEVKLKNLYSKIQTQLFYMIPEKWSKIYLYASVIDNSNNVQTGEMFFYYYPTGILKKNPINVYEVPTKFNVDENAYMKLADNLYDTIKLLRKEFKKQDEKLWNSLTISVENLKFKIEYDYEDMRKYSNDERHIIWQYKYMNLPLDRLSKSNRKMIEEYLLEEKLESNHTKEHTENMYQKHVHNNVEFDREEIDVEEIEPREEWNQKLDKYEKYREKKKQEQIETEKKEYIETKNQILNF